MAPFTDALNMFRQNGIRKQIPLPQSIIDNNEYKLNDVLPYPHSDNPKLSIITIHGKLQNHNKEETLIDVEKIYMSFVNQDCIETIMKLVQICKSNGYKIIQIQNGTNILSLETNTISISDTKGFPHGCSFKAIPSGDQSKVDHSRVIDIKLFKKGKLQATGCKSLEEINVLASKIIDIIHVTTNNKYVFSHPTLSMIKANFNINFKINLDRLVGIIDQHYQHELTRNYSPEFRGLTLKWVAPFCTVEHGKQQRVTFIIHSSGNIALMCNKDQSNVIHCWNYINNILKTFYKEIVIQ